MDAFRMFLTFRMYRRLGNVQSLIGIGATSCFYRTIDYPAGMI